MFSVCMCTYNGEAYLPSKLNQLAQSSELISEIIVVDDCSTDSPFKFYRLGLK